MNKQNNYYNPREVAYLYGVSETAVYRWIREGKLKAVLLEGDWDDTGRIHSVYSYGIPKSELVDLNPIKGGNSLGMLERASKKHETQAYMDWLDEQSIRLYQEIEFIEQMKEYVRRNEPYF